VGKKQSNHTGATSAALHKLDAPEIEEIITLFGSLANARNVLRM
jgi:hypothetical protein